MSATYESNDVPEHQEVGMFLAQAAPGEDVVISGMAGRFPLSDNIEEFQNNLLNKVNMVVQKPRWDPLPNTQNIHGLVNSIEKFDAGFFGVHYNQANHMDPQVRLLLEHTFEAIVDAGYNPNQLKGSRVGVYIANNYMESNKKLLFDNTENSLGLTGCTFSSLAQWISYCFGFQGQSVMVDTACSSSLSALNDAYRAIKSNECDSAIVGAAHLCLHWKITLQMGHAGVLNLDGKCKCFDADTDGMIRSEAVSVIYLQKEKDARRIYAKVVHMKTSSGHNAEVGFLSPSSLDQEELIKSVYHEAQVHPNDISYVEAHSTGTAVGDPIEIESIDKAYFPYRDEPLHIGSTKSNVGHSEPASGLSSIIKVICSMEIDRILPNLHYKKAKKGDLPLETGRLIVVTEPTLWSKDDPIIAGVNNFGMGGTSAHLLLKRVSLRKYNNGRFTDNLPRLVCVSGRTKSSVEFILNRVTSTAVDTEFIRLLHEVFSDNISGHAYRGYTILGQQGELTRSISHLSNTNKSICLHVGGLSSATINCGRHLYKLDIFKTILQRIQEILVPMNVNVVETLFCQNIFDDSAMYGLGNILIQIALVNLLNILGIHPECKQTSSEAQIACDYANRTISLYQAVTSAYNFIHCITDDCNNKLHSENLVNGSTPTVVLKIGQNCQDLEGLNLTDAEDFNAFLLVLARMYELGHNVQIHNLYPEIKWPVGRGTSMIAPLIKWNHLEDWFVAEYPKIEATINGRRFITLDINHPTWMYMKGHVVDGRNLIPATGYLFMVWESISNLTGKPLIDTNITFENIRIHQAISFSKKAKINFTVGLLSKIGQFEIEQFGQPIVTGSFSTDISEMFQTIDRTIISCNTFDDSHVTLNRKDIYKDFSLRGYNYVYAFKGLNEATVGETKGLITWQNNWVVFMDNMLQIMLLQVHTRNLYVPIAIERITIDPKRHLEYIKKVGEDCVPVHACIKTKTIRSGFIEIKEILAAAINRRTFANEVLLETYKFIPFETRLPFDEAIRVCVQIFCENSVGKHSFEVVEIADEDFESEDALFAPVINQTLNALPYVRFEIRVLTKKKIQCENVTIDERSELTDVNSVSLIAATGVLQRHQILEKSLRALKQEGMILSKENLKVNVKAIASTLGLNVICIYETNSDQIVLLSRICKFTISNVVDVSNNDEKLEWLPKLKDELADDKELLLYSQNEKCSGLLGLFNCLKLERGNHLRSFLIVDEAPNFNVTDPFYLKQIQKRLTVNVYKNGAWGTYRHMRLSNSKPVNKKHVTGRFTSIGDFSSFSWSEENNYSFDSNDEDIPIHVYYTALNFRDVMKASGRVSGTMDKDESKRHNAIGFEFSGKDSTGNRFMGISLMSSLASTILCNPCLLIGVPDKWSLAEAATVPVVYLTVIYSLIIVGRIKKHQSILIHAGSGGIGQAAINIALHYECNIFTTVGNEEKKNFLLKQFPQIPVTHIGNSRDTSFEQIIFRETNGNGIDFVLNSLSGEKSKASVRCLAPGGKFLEIGKFDALQNHKLSYDAFHQNRSFHGIMLDSHIENDSAELHSIVALLIDGIKQKFVKPLNRTVFEARKVEEAFRYLSKGDHIGKVLIQIRKGDVQEMFDALPRMNCNPKSSYIIIGGLGGFGLELANWLISRGAKNIVLTSRKRVQTGYQQMMLRVWKQKGANILISTSDITEKAGCLEILNEAGKTGSIDGVFNLAVVLKDALIENQSQEDFEVVLKPKSIATRYFDVLTRELCPKLRYFVVFSSVTCGKGNFGQTNYGMANSIMERICEQRKSDGYPGLAIQWGIVGNVGVVAEMFNNEGKMRLGDIVGQPIQSCLGVLDSLLTQTEPIVSSMVISKDRTSGVNKTDAIQHIAEQILGIDNLNSVSFNSTLSELGIDSISTTILHQTLEREYDVCVSQTDLKEMTLAKLQKLIVSGSSEDSNDALTTTKK